MKIMNGIFIKIAVIGAVLLMMPISYLYASSVREVSTDELIQQSQFVFEGNVTGVESKLNDQNRIHTHVTFSITDVLKGSYDKNVITLRFLGGTVGEVTMSVSDMKIPQIGEHGIYFVESLERNQINPFYGSSQGHFLVGRDASGIDRVMTSSKHPVKSVLVKKSNKQTITEMEGVLTLSKCAAADIVVDSDNKLENGLSLEDFKSVMRQKRDKK